MQSIREIVLRSNSRVFFSKYYLITLYLVVFECSITSGKRKKVKMFFKNHKKNDILENYQKHSKMFQITQKEQTNIVPKEFQKELPKELQNELKKVHKWSNCYGGVSARSYAVSYFRYNIPKNKISPKCHISIL